LRRLLDEIDPPSVIVLASEESIEDAREAVSALGYEGDVLVRVASAPSEEASALVVFYDLPIGPAEVAKVAAAAPAQVIALVAPRQIPALRRLTTGAVEPLDVTQLSAKARVRDERLRSTLRAELEAGFPAREIMALEPLLADFDGIEIAAAALRLIERDRSESRARRADAERPVERSSERPVDRATERASAPGGDRVPSRGAGEFTRVFLSIGDRDGVRAGDLVGAITGESGITSDRIGKLEIRDSHTVAEIAAADAATVVDKMNGVSLKGRRLSARVDDRPARSREGGRDTGRDARRPAGGSRGFREGSRGGARDGARGGFGARRERPTRDGGGREGRESSGKEGRFSREGRPPRAPGRDRFAAGDRRPRREDDSPRGRSGFRDRPDEGRVPRAAREREEWSDRADRVRNARRPRRDDA
jgi:ATP-dependent RNA helicase DeaD